MSNSEEKHRHGKRFLKITGMVIAGIAFAVMFALVFGLVVQYLWNWAMPDIFGLKAITYWQAFALVILAKIFFGSFGRHHNGRGHDCGPRPWGHGRRGWHGGFSDHDRKHFEQYWHDEGKTAFDEYMKRIESEKKDNA